MPLQFDLLPPVLGYLLQQEGRSLVLLGYPKRELVGDQLVQSDPHAPHIALLHVLKLRPLLVHYLQNLRRHELRSARKGSSVLLLP